MCKGEKTVSEEFNERRISVDQSFFICVPVSNADGTVDLSAEMVEGHSTLEKAVEQATNLVEEHGGSAVVYYVSPRRRVRRLPITTVDDLTK
jgi:hypothetical protein